MTFGKVCAFACCERSSRTRPGRQRRRLQYHLQGHERISKHSLFATSIDGGVDSISVASGVTSSTQVFEPILPQTEVLLAFGIIVVLSAVATWVWANQVVPVSRTKLAISKSRGEVKEYLDELKASDPSMTNATTTEMMLIASSNATDTESTPMTSSNTVSMDDRKFERWLFADWLQDNKSARKNGRQKEPALPILKDAKWNSGDNPVLVASALLGAGVLFSAATEKIASLV